MAGRPLMKVYLYDEVGKYLGDFESVAEFARVYNLQKNVLSTAVSPEGIYDFPDGKVASTRRIGRENVKLRKRYQANPFVGAGKTIAKAKYEKAGIGKVLGYDLDGELVVTYANPFVFSKVTGYPCTYCYSNDHNGANPGASVFGLRYVIESTSVLEDA